MKHFISSSATSHSKPDIQQHVRTDPGNTTGMVSGGAIDTQQTSAGRDISQRGNLEIYQHAQFGGFVAALVSISYYYTIVFFAVFLCVSKLGVNIPG